MILKNILFTMFWKQQNGRVRYSVLPPGFIESDGVFDAPSGYKPYVNTGLLLSPSAQKKWTIEFSYHGCTNPVNIAVMGTSYSKTSGNYALWVDNSDGTNGRKIEFIFGNGNAGRKELAQYKYDKNVLITENRHKYEMNLLTGQGFIDDVCVITAGAVASVPNPTPVVFHAVWRGSSVFNTGAGTIHSLKIGDPSDGGLIRDYIPCIRLSDGLPGFYDLCESTDGVDGTPFYKLQLASGSDNPTTVPTYNTSFSVRVKKNTTGTCKVTLSATQMTAGVVSVDWGDDATEELTSASSSSTHSYSTAGEYDLTVSSETARGFTMSQSETISSITRLLSYDCKIVPVGFMYGATSLNFGNNILGNVYWIQASAFRDCTSLTLTELPKPLKRIDEYAFYNSGVGITRIPKKVNFIGDYAFGNCANLTRITFEGDEVTDISSTAFQGCTNLTDIYVPWHMDEVAGAPWGAGNAKIHYKAWLLPPSNEIWYYGSSQATLFSDTNVVSHTFSDGKGVITFAAPITQMPNVLRGTSVTLVNMPDSVTSIVSSAFFNCASLKNVVLSPNITSIESYAFYQCGNMRLSEFPDKLTELGQGAFRGCSSISTTSLPAGVTNIPRETFYGCTSLALTGLPSGMTRIEDNTFDSCTNLALTSLPNGITFIGNAAFYGCSKIQLSSLPNTVTEISGSVFRDCQGLTLTSLPSGLTSLGGRAFYNCQNLALTSLPDGLTSIPAQCFYNCSNLALTFLPSGITSIGQQAFASCVNITLTSLPAGLTSIEDNVFDNCPKISISSLPPEITKIGGNAFYGDLLVSVDCIPETVTTISANVFNSCAGITSLIFIGTPNSISPIAFNRCTNLTDIYVPWAEGTVADAPWGATNATVHYNSQMMPKSNEIWYYGESQATLFSNTNVASHTFDNGKGIVRYNSNLTTMPDTLRGTSVTRVVLPITITSIGSDALRECTDLTSVVFPQHLRTIGNNAFRYCSNLECDGLPSSVTSISGWAFQYCSKIAWTSLPEELTEIGSYCFQHCSSLAITSIPDGITELNPGVFDGCTSLALTSLPSGLTTIADGTFWGCANISLNHIPASIVSIGNNAFNSCTGLSVVYLITQASISSSAFSECTNLTDIYVPWVEGDVANAPWGASNATVHYMDGKTLEDVQYTDETMKHHVVKAMYIPSSGGRRLSSDMVINTRHNTTVNDEWIVTCKADHRASGDMCIMGSSNSNTNTNCAIWMNPTTNTVRFLFGDATRSDTVVSTIEYDITKFHTYRIKFSTGQAWIDDNLIGTAGSVSSFANACPLYILTSGQVSYSSGFLNNTQIFNGDVVDVKVLTNDNLTLHYVPWSDLEPYECGFYETVSGTELEMHRWVKPLFEWNLAWTVSLTSNNLTYGLSTKLYDNIAVVYWGDGTFEQLSQTDDSVTIFTHTYAKAGQYNVTFFAYYSGDFVCTTGHNGFINSEPVYKDRVKSVLYVKGTLVPTYFCFKASSITQVPSHLFEGKLAIGSDAFGGCQNLNISSIGNDVQFIGYSSFGGCTSLTALAMPSVRHLLPYAFQDCTALGSVNLPSIVELSSGSFSNCTGLRSITFGENLCELSYNAFFGCTALETAIFEGSAVEYIPEELFEECTNLTDIYVPWEEGTVNNAPWGATNATVHYNHQV